MEIRRSLEADCTAAVLYPFVEDLGQYPQWMPLVHDVTTATPTTIDGAGGDPAWQVELRAQVGPLARSKRLRMARTAHEPRRLVVFERAEVDGKNHAPWVLRAALTESVTHPERTLLTMTLRYGGTLWTGGILERVLDDQVRKGSEALLDLVNARPTH